MMIFLTILVVASTAAYLATAVAVSHILSQDVVRGAVLQNEDLPGVAVVVAARDEENRLSHCLDALLTQDYPGERLSIVVVDDYSSDRTALIAHDFSARDHRLLVVESADADVPPGKAHALAAGIRSTSEEIILTTDADCTPSPYWVRSMVLHVMKEGAAAVGGPTTVSGGALPQQIQAIDWMLLLAVAGAFSHAGRPITAMGLNMGFRRELYDTVGGYDAFSGSPTEDYELFRALDQLPGRRSRLVIEPSLRTTTRPTESLRQTWSQRRRWARGGLSASPLTYVVYAVAWSAHALPLAYLWVEPLTAAFCWAIKAAGDALVISRYARRLRTDLPWRAFIPFQLFLTAYVVLMPASLVLAPRLRWKGRRL